MQSSHEVGGQQEENHWGAKSRKPLCVTKKNKPVPVPAKLTNAPDHFSTFLYDAAIERRELPSTIESYSIENNAGKQLPPLVTVSPAMHAGELLSEKPGEISQLPTEGEYLVGLSIKIPAAEEHKLEKVIKREVIFFVDDSGSMDWYPDEREDQTGKLVDAPAGQSKLALAKAAVQHFTKQYLSADDYISLYTFNKVAKKEFEHCLVSDFNQPGNINHEKFNAIKAGGTTKIGECFYTFMRSTGIPSTTENQILIVLLTDGQDGKDYTTNVQAIVEQLNKKFPGKNICVYPIGIGEKYDGKVVGNFATATPTGLATNIHVTNGADIENKFEFMGEVIIATSIPSIPVKLSVTMKDGTKIPLDLKEVKPGDEYSCVFTLKKKTNLHRTPLTITCEYGDGTENIFTYSTPLIVNNKQYDYEVLNLRALKLGNEVIESVEFKVAEDSMSRGPLTWDSVTEEKLVKFRAWFFELAKARDMLARQGQADYTSTINALNETMQRLSNVFMFYAEQLHPKLLPPVTSGKNSASEKTNSTRKANNTFKMAAALSSTKARGKYLSSGRTAPMNRQLAGLCESNPKQVKQVGDYYTVEFDRPQQLDKSTEELTWKRTSPYRVINSELDFSQEAFTPGSQYISLDGGLSNREGILIGDEEFSSIWQLNQLAIEGSASLAVGDKLRHFVNILRKNMRLPESSEEEAYLTWKSFQAESGYLVELANDMVLPCVNLSSFFPLGYCRHMVLFMVLLLAQAMDKPETLEKAPLKVFRYTAYNQQAHSWVMYELNEQELYLIDPTMPSGQEKVFNLRDQAQLIAALQAYNARGLNGILNHLIKEKGLQDLLIGREDLFTVERINSAVAEQFDQHPAFRSYLSALSKQLPTKIVRLRLKNMITGDEELSSQFYDEDEIKEYIQKQQEDAFYPRELALDPMGTMCEIVGIEEDAVAKQAIIDLIVQHSMSALPEKCASVLMTSESDERNAKRSKSVSEAVMANQQHYLTLKEQLDGTEKEKLEKSEITKAPSSLIETEKVENEAEEYIEEDEEEEVTSLSAGCTYYPNLKAQKEKEIKQPEEIKNQKEDGEKERETGNKPIADDKGKGKEKEIKQGIIEEVVDRVTLSAELEQATNPVLVHLRESGWTVQPIQAEEAFYQDVRRGMHIQGASISSSLSGEDVDALFTRTYEWDQKRYQLFKQNYVQIGLNDLPIQAINAVNCEQHNLFAQDDSRYININVIDGKIFLELKYQHLSLKNALTNTVYEVQGLVEVTFELTDAGFQLRHFACSTLLLKQLCFTKEPLSAKQIAGLPERAIKYQREIRNDRKLDSKEFVPIDMNPNRLTDPHWLAQSVKHMPQRSLGYSDFKEEKSPSKKRASQVAAQGSSGYGLKGAVTGAVVGGAGGFAVGLALAILTGGVAAPLIPVAMFAGMGIGTLGGYITGKILNCMCRNKTAALPEQLLAEGTMTAPAGGSSTLLNLFSSSRQGYQPVPTEEFGRELEQVGLAEESPKDFGDEEQAADNDKKRKPGSVVTLGQFAAPANDKAKALARNNKLQPTQGVGRRSGLSG